jgi:DNA-binding IclR family transcriptional regulator
MSPEKKNEILKNMTFEQLTPHTTTDPDLFYEELELTKHRGYAVSESERVEGVSCVAAPIFGVKGEILGALTISGPSTRFSEQKIKEHAEVLMKITQQISQSMGSHLSETKEELFSPSKLPLEQ